LIPTLTRFIKSRFYPGPGARKRKVAGLKDLQVIRNALMQTVHDCHGVPPQRLRHKIQHAVSAQELWMLRNDAFQLISQQTSQRVAAERINELMTVFEGWLEPSQIVRIK
jgi:hypothetical protein